MIYILIPSYNDAQNLPRLFASIRKFVKTRDYKIIIVDDGSTDNTKDQIKKLSANYPASRIGYKKNRGPGYAFNFGFNYLIPKLKNQDILITMEADNTADFGILKTMIEKSQVNDVVLASPYATGGEFLGLEPKRKILSVIANILDMLIFQIKGVKTYSSFYRVYQPRILKKAKSFYRRKLITENGFSAVVELLIKLAKLDAKITEVPATIDWRGRIGKSKMELTKTVIRHLNLYYNYFSGKYNL